MLAKTVLNRAFHDFNPNEVRVWKGRRLAPPALRDHTQQLTTSQMKKQTQPQEIKENIHAKHVFTQDELMEISRELGRTCTVISTLEQEKNAVTKDFASRIETNEIKRDSLVDKVTSGYEMRATDCIVILDPKNRSKDYFRINPDGTKGEFVERREMTEADFQLSLPEADKS